ncbi:phosphoribosyl-ATP diphosphatase [Allorhizobium pseudoryzae]|uniref:phosphoribosyl-ATP diphosphatase n=1 Tax=Allorhizobium pseudoryzae TaxID=379684 RepID=UPI003CFF183D
MSEFTIFDLEEIVAHRVETASPDESWTAKLYAGGQKVAAKKLGEEALEAVIAAVSEDDENLAYEAADVIFHLAVVLKIAGVSFAEVVERIAIRLDR